MKDNKFKKGRDYYAMENRHVMVSPTGLSATSSHDNFNSRRLQFETYYGDETYVYACAYTDVRGYETVNLRIDGQLYTFSAERHTEA